MPLSPVTTGSVVTSRLSLGLTPQALCFRLLRRLANVLVIVSVLNRAPDAFTPNRNRLFDLRIKRTQFYLNSFSFKWKLPPSYCLP
jgi:hypothetical protein